MSDAAESTIDPAVMEAGKLQFLLCQACHGPEGKGIDKVGPPLAGSEWVMGPAENLIRIQLRGLDGPIPVKGTEYSFAAPMPAQPFQTDEQIAQVLTYVRNSFGNEAPAVTAAEVLALRSEVGKPPLTVADLIPPEAAEAGDAEAAATPTEAGGDDSAVASTTEPATDPVTPYDLGPSIGLPIWVWGLALVWLAICILPVLRRRD